MMAGGGHWTTQLSGQPPCSGVTFIEGDGPTKSAVFPCHDMMAGGRHWTTQLSGQPPAEGSPLLKVMAQLRVLFSHAMT